jgi:hypothetical protein
MSLAGCQINPIDVNFHLQKSLEKFDKNSADKIQSMKDKGIKVPSLIPIRDKYLYVNSIFLRKFACLVTL